MQFFEHDDTWSRPSSGRDRLRPGRQRRPVHALQGRAGHRPSTESQRLDRARRSTPMARHDKTIEGGGASTTALQDPNSAMPSATPSTSRPSWTRSSAVMASSAARSPALSGKWHLEPPTCGRSTSRSQSRSSTRPATRSSRAGSDSTSTKPINLRMTCRALEQTDTESAEFIKEWWKELGVGVDRPVARR